MFRCSTLSGLPMNNLTKGLYVIPLTKKSSKKGISGTKAPEASNYEATLNRRQELDHFELWQGIAFKDFSTNSFLNSFYSSKFVNNKEKQIKMLNNYVRKFI